MSELQVKFVWNILPLAIKNLLKWLWNLFPLKTKSLNNFIEIVRDSDSLIEIKPVIESEISQNIIINPDSISYNQPLTKIIGKKYLVRVKAFLKANGKEVVYERLCGFLPTNKNGLVDPLEERRFHKKMLFTANKFLEVISKKIPSNRAKIISN